MPIAGTGVSHCPAPAVLGGFPIIPIGQMLQEGVNVSLGVDGSATNDSSNLLDTLRMAYLMQCFYSKQRKGAVSAYDLLKIATKGGARTLGREDIGSLEVGKALLVVSLQVGGRSRHGILSRGLRPVHGLHLPQRLERTDRASVPAGPVRIAAGDLDIRLVVGSEIAKLHVLLSDRTGESLGAIGTDGIAIGIQRVLDTFPAEDAEHVAFAGTGPFHQLDDFVRLALIDRLLADRPNALGGNDRSDGAFMVGTIRWLDDDELSIGEVRVERGVVVLGMQGGELPAEASDTALLVLGSEIILLERHPVRIDDPAVHHLLHELHELEKFRLLDHQVEG